jgi:hypothetical protein
MSSKVQFFTTVTFAAWLAACGNDSATPVVNQDECSATAPCATGYVCMIGIKGNHVCVAKPPTVSLPDAGVVARMPDARPVLQPGTAPGTIIVSKPPAITNETTARFTFMSDPAGATSFMCSLDGAMATACASDQSFPMMAGAHTLVVKAVLEGVSDPTGAAYKWVIDAMPPDTTITDAPPLRTNATTASFSFTSTELGSFRCKLDGLGEDTCGSPRVFTGLAPGDHSFSVYAVDQAGNKDPTPATYRWSVLMDAGDLNGPDVVLVPPTPPGHTDAMGIYEVDVTQCGLSTPGAEITFNGTDPEGNGPVTFTCAVDGMTPADCSNGDGTGHFTYEGLPGGEYLLHIVGYDTKGNPGPANPLAPGSVGLIVAFTVDGEPPTVTASVVSDLAVNGTKVTSGGGNIGLYGLIRADVGRDAVDINGTGVTCFIDPTDPNNPSTGVSCGGTYLHGFTFGYGDVPPLLDENSGGFNPHNIVVSAHDACANTGRATATFVVDSTPPEIDFAGFYAVNATDPESPDMVSGTAAVARFAIVDNQPFPGLEDPPILECDLDGHKVICSRDTAPGTYKFAWPMAGFSQGLLANANPHRIDIFARDGVGNRNHFTTPFSVVDGPRLILDTSTFPACVDTEGNRMGKDSGMVGIMPDMLGAALAFSCHLDGPTARDDVSCAAGDDSCGCSAGMGYPFVGLGEGVYTLTVVATDPLGQKTKSEVGFRVDLTGPNVTFINPGPLPQFPTNIPQGPNAGGTFVIDPDYATTQGTYQLLWDYWMPGTAGVASYAADMPVNATYSVTQLQDGYHNLQVTVSDCVGNMNQAYYGVAVDSAPPNGQIVTNSLAVNTGGNPFMVVQASDTTNIEDMRCALDQPGVTPTDPCPGLAGDGGGKAGKFASGGGVLPTTYGQLYANLIYGQLSPGRHILRYQLRDAFATLDPANHIGPVVEYTFFVNYTDTGDGVTKGGHAVLSGVDFSSVAGMPDECAGAGPDCQHPIEKLAGNLVGMTPMTQFAPDRPLHVLILDGALDALGSGGRANQNGEIDAITHAVDVRLSVSSLTAVYTRMGNLSELPNKLLGQDVLLIPDQNDATWITRQMGQNPAWFGNLQNFVNRGGIVGVFDGLDSNGNPSNTWQLLGGAAAGVPIPIPKKASDPAPAVAVAAQAYATAGKIPIPVPCRGICPPGGGGGGTPLISMTGLVPGADSSAGNGLHNGMEKVCATDSQVATDLGNTVSEPWSTVRFNVGDPIAADVFMSCHGCTNDPITADNPPLMQPVVIDKAFSINALPKNVLRGYAYVDGVRRGRTSRAVFSDSDGNVVATCPLFPDGFTEHQVAPGAMLTIAYDGSASGPRTLETLYDASPPETVVVGFSTPPATAFPSISVEVPEFVNATGPVTVHVTDGCDTVEALALPDGMNATTTLAVDSSCAPNNLGIIAEAYVGDVLVGYARAVSLAGKGGGFSDVTAADWKNLSADPAVYQPWATSPLIIDINVNDSQLAAGVNSTHPYDVDALLIDWDAPGTVFPTKRSPDIQTWEPEQTPQIANFWYNAYDFGATERVRTVTRIAYSALNTGGDAYTPVSVLETSAGLPATTTAGTPAPILVAPNDALPRINSRARSYDTATHRFAYSWIADTNPYTPISGADGMFAQFTLPMASGCTGAAPTWNLAFESGTSETGARRTPALPADAYFTCLAPASTPSWIALAAFMNNSSGGDATKKETATETQVLAQRQAYALAASAVYVKTVIDKCKTCGGGGGTIAPIGWTTFRHVGLEGLRGELRRALFGRVEHYNRDNETMVKATIAK